MERSWSHVRVVLRMAAILVGLCVLLVIAVSILRVVSDQYELQYFSLTEDKRGLKRIVPEPVLADIARKIIFRGAVVFEAVQSGQHDVLVVEVSRTGRVLHNLTDSPADETFPAWSPDGNWIAYLSDGTGPGGAKGKVELFARQYPEGQVIQITGAPEIEWSGPLNWSYSFSTMPSNPWLEKPYIVLRGSKRGGPPAVYLIPVDGNDTTLRRLEETEGAVGQVEFQYGWLNFARADGMLVTRNYATQEDYELNRPDLPRGLGIVPGAFGHDNWTFYYLSRGEPPDGEVGVQISIGGVEWVTYCVTPTPSPPAPLRTPVVTPTPMNINGTETYPTPPGPVLVPVQGNALVTPQALISGRLGTIQAIIPIKGRRFAALQDGALDGSGADGCLRMRVYDLWRSHPAQESEVLFPALCFDPLPDGFDPTGAWIEPLIKHQYLAVWRVFSGREPGADPARQSLYATLIYDSVRYTNLAQVRRIPVYTAGALVPGSPRIRPDFSNNRTYQKIISDAILPKPVR